jgi:hypothetical protein
MHPLRKLYLEISNGKNYSSDIIKENPNTSLPKFLRKFVYTSPIEELRKETSMIIGKNEPSVERLENKVYDEIHFRNGYSKNSPFMKVEWKGMKKENDQYVILLGKIIK